MLAQTQLNRNAPTRPTGRQPTLSAAPDGLCCGRPWGRFIPKFAARRGFTLIELLVVLAIIAILIGILLPAISALRTQGYVSSTTAEMATVQAACLMYHSNYDAYPGPFSESDIANGRIASTGGALTGTQNMLIGLMGTTYNTSSVSLPPGTTLDTMSGSTSGGGTAYVTTPLGSGPIDYSKGNVQQKSYLSLGNILIQTISANHGVTNLPTLYDTFIAGLPILYYRKVAGMPGTSGTPVSLNTPPAAFLFNANIAYTSNWTTLIATNGYAPNYPPPSPGSSFASSYNVQALAYEVTSPSGYTVSSTNSAVGSSVTPSGAPNAVGEPVTGGFVLISAGPDRLYGPPLAQSGQLTWASAATNDDIVVAGGQ